MNMLMVIMMVTMLVVMNMTMGMMIAMMMSSAMIRRMRVILPCEFMRHLCPQGSYRKMNAAYEQRPVDCRLNMKTYVFAT